MSGGAYFWRDYRATVSGSTVKPVRCINCSHVFEYLLQRTAAGGGHSPFFLTNAGAAEKARQRARANLDRALGVGIDPVHCPACGMTGKRGSEMGDHRTDGPVASAAYWLGL
jgi:hypothetical protein